MSACFVEGKCIFIRDSSENTFRTEEISNWMNYSYIIIIETIF